MSYATLMVQLELGRSNAAPLSVVRDLAKRLRVPVTGVAGAQPIQTAVMADGFYAGDIVREDSEWIEQEARAAEAEFRSGLTGHAEGLDWEMAVTRYPLSERIADATATADILVVGVAQGSADSSNPTRQVDVDDLVMQTGRPVLVVPLDIRHFEFRTALVAWKDTREARRALADSLPLLRLMNKVVIAAIADPVNQKAVQADLDKMVAWLARHGVAATARLALPAGADGDRLLDLADEEGAELIVAGAYGHSRFREWVLGGVTRDLLHRGRRCLLLSH
jgi:nucleotide-binding universal stress UspA family protein